jgi:hypothetical protein
LVGFLWVYAHKVWSVEGIRHAPLPLPLPLSFIDTYRLSSERRGCNVGSQVAALLFILGL